jgi:hypothetical protein
MRRRLLVEMLTLMVSLGLLLCLHQIRVLIMVWVVKVPIRVMM